MSEFRVNLKKVVDDSYDISIGHDLVQELILDLKEGLVGKIKRFAIITDSNVYELYAKDIYTKVLEAGFKSDIFVVEAGEKSKTRETKARLEDEMLNKGYRRDCCVIAVGGGVVSDIAGFLAGTYGRGVPFINYATTFLAAADASIGGKTAVDTPLATNLIGLFNQPKKVYIDINTWKTLPKREMISGMAETIKHACIADATMFEFLEKNMEKIYEFDKEACDYISKQNCKIKYNVVMKDEKESGLREILNLGHTVGRAIETTSDYKLLHGEAVAIGLVAEVLLAKKLGYVTEKDVERVIKLLEKAQLPTTIPNYIDREILVKKLYTDKKVRDGKLRFVLQKGIGDVVVFGDNLYATPIDEEVAREIINQIK
ncbi:3-dehydroquinate synthase [Lachnospiraceae bacterium C7]|nr:3-dehydroquinate synthase [Lachnospiraceae bacterium C7]